MLVLKLVYASRKCFRSVQYSVLSANFAGDSTLFTSTLHKNPKKLLLEDSFAIETGSCKIKSSDLAHLDSVAIKIIAFNPKKLIVSRQFDDVGDVIANDVRSLRRAEAILEYLRTKIDLNKVHIETYGYANTKHLLEESSEEARATN